MPIPLLPIIGAAAIAAIGVIAAVCSDSENTPKDDISGKNCVPPTPSLETSENSKKPHKSHQKTKKEGGYWFPPFNEN